MSQKGIVKNSTSADVNAQSFAPLIQAIFGASGICNVFSNLACAKVNDNSVSVAQGVYSLSGYPVVVDQNGITLAIDSGTAGYRRNDIVAAEFVRNGGGTAIDTLRIRVIKGTATTGTPADPTLTQNDINGSGTTRQEAIWRIKIVGTAITAVERVAQIISPLAMPSYIFTSPDYALASGVAAIVPYNAKAVRGLAVDDSLFSVSGGSITINKTGVYDLEMDVFFPAMAAGTELELSAFLDGSTQIMIESRGACAAQTAFGKHKRFAANAGQILTCRAKQTSGGNISINADTYTGFSNHLILSRVQ